MKRILRHLLRWILESYAVNYWPQSICDVPGCDLPAVVTRYHLGEGDRLCKVHGAEEIEILERYGA